MSAKKPTKRYRKSSASLTKNGKRVGRPRLNMSDRDFKNPLGPPVEKDLTTLRIVRAVLSATRPKYAEDLAARTQAVADERAVDRVAKQLERDRKRVKALKGERKI